MTKRIGLILTADVAGVIDAEASWQSDSCSGLAETSQEHSLSSSNRLGCREGQVFGIGLAGLEAVVEAAEEAVEQVALRGSVSIAGHTTPGFVVSSGTG